MLPNLSALALPTEVKRRLDGTKKLEEGMGRLALGPQLDPAALARLTLDEPPAARPRPTEPPDAAMRALGLVDRAENPSYQEALEEALAPELRRLRLALDSLLAEERMKAMIDLYAPSWEEIEEQARNDTRGDMLRLKRMLDQLATDAHREQTRAYTAMLPYRMDVMERAPSDPRERVQWWKQTPTFRMIQNGPATTAFRNMYYTYYNLYKTRQYPVDPQTGLFPQRYYNRINALLWTKHWVADYPMYEWLSGVMEYRPDEAVVV